LGPVVIPDPVKPSLDLRAHNLLQLPALWQGFSWRSIEGEVDLVITAQAGRPEPGAALVQDEPRQREPLSEPDLEERVRRAAQPCVGVWGRAGLGGGLAGR